MALNFEWNDVKVMLALEHAGHMGDAARALGVSATTILRRVAAMEQALGCALFHRGPERWQLTQAGARTLPLARAMELDAVSLMRAAQVEPAELRGTVRLSAPEVLTSDFLAPLFPALRARFPEVALEVSATNQVVNLSRREADVALRLNRPQDRSVVARRLARITTTLAAATSYLATRGLPTPATLSQHDFVWTTRAFDDSSETRWLHRHAREAKLVFRSDSTHGRSAVVRAGLGLTFLPGYLVDATDGLARVTTLPALPSRELWLIVHREARRQLSVRAFADALAELILANRARLGP